MNLESIFSLQKYANTYFIIFSISDVKYRDN